LQKYNDVHLVVRTGSAKEKTRLREYIMQMSEKRKGGNEKIPNLEKFFLLLHRHKKCLQNCVSLGR
jgi:hypothetical protein